jgi:peptide/nickel transport system substrate-binding protein
MRRINVFLTWILAPMLCIAACTSNNSKSTENSSASANKAGPKANENQMNTQPRDNVSQGGKITWAVDGTIPNFNLNQLDGPNAANNWLMSAVVPGLFNFDAAGTPSYNPDYLTGEPALSAGPPQVVTYELNPKAIWYDGTPITSADFIAQWKALNGSNPGFRIASSTGYERIQTVAQGKDKYEVIVTFKTPFADWKSIFSGLLPASTNSNPDVFNTGWKDRALTSAGPFKFQNYDATAKTYTLVANEKWWGNKPKVDEIVFRVIDDDAMPGALANGEIDLMDVGPSASAYDKVKAIAGVDVRVAGGPNFRHLTMNGQSPMLQDVNVRQALAMAIDRAAIARAELGPLPVQPQALGNHIFMENQAGYQDNSAVVAYNPSKAKQMLDTAGWVVQGNKRVKNGRALVINLVIPGGIAVSRSEAELVQNMLAQVNVEVDINTVPTDGFFDKYITPGRFDFTLFSWLGTPFPISSSRSIYGKPVGDKIQQNFARIGSDELDRIYAEAVGELDPAKAIELANEADKLIWAEVHSLTDYQRPDMWAAKKNLANMGAYGFASIRYEDIGWVKGGAQ